MFVLFDILVAIGCLIWGVYIWFLIAINHTHDENNINLRKKIAIPVIIKLIIIGILMGCFKGILTVACVFFALIPIICETYYEKQPYED